MESALEKAGVAVRVHVHSRRRSQLRREHARMRRARRRLRRRMRRSISSTACSAGAFHENYCRRVELAADLRGRCTRSRFASSPGSSTASCSSPACGPGSAYRWPRRPFASCAGGRRSPCKRWSGVFHADRPAPMCLQTLRTRTMNHYFGNEATSEDCLYLNVWAPPQRREAARDRVDLRRRVQRRLRRAWPITRARTSRASGVVRVNLAYRLGALGFLAHPELTAESGYGGSGNYGLMDLIAGLRWVQQQHRCVRRRSRQRHDRRAIGGLDGGRACCKRAPRRAACSTKRSA